MSILIHLNIYIAINKCNFSHSLTVVSPIRIFPQNVCCQIAIKISDKNQEPAAFYYFSWSKYSWGIKETFNIEILNASYALHKSFLFKIIAYLGFLAYRHKGVITCIIVQYSSVQTFNFCTSRPDVCQCLVVWKPC